MAIVYGMRTDTDPTADLTRHHRGHERVSDEADFSEVRAGRASPSTNSSASPPAATRLRRRTGGRAEAVLAAPGFDEAKAESVRRWQQLWADADCEIVGDDKAAHAVRFSIYHLLIAANPTTRR